MTKAEVIEQLKDLDWTAAAEIIVKYLKGEMRE